MLDVRLLVEGVSGLHDLGHAADGEFKLAGGHVGHLGVRVAVHCAHLALLEFDLDHHDVVVVAEDLAHDAVAGVVPAGLGLEDEIAALLCHCLFVLDWLGFGSLLGLVAAGCGQQDGRCEGDEGGDSVHFGLYFCQR